MIPNYIYCPCKKCIPPKRHALCHSDCQDYLDYKKKVQIEGESIKKELEISRAINEMAVQGATCLTRPQALKRKKKNNPRTNFTAKK